MFKTKLKYALIALVPVTLAACIGTIHGGGVVNFFDVDTGNGDGEPTSAALAVTVSCNDKRDMVRSTVHLTDNTNGANVTALLPWTPITEIFGSSATCEEAAAIVDELGFSVSPAIINSQGQESGIMYIAVAEQGVIAECGEDEQAVQIGAESNPDVLPGGYYAAYGCLVKGNIVFQ